jgi:Gamma-glutamyl cyclotransferase, AIG2-like
MARMNPNPYTRGHLFALVHRVTGLLDSEDEVMAAVRALEEAGVATDDIDIFVGEQGARCLDLSGREHGRAFRLLRTLEAAVGDERETNDRIDKALRRGATLLCVKVHKRKRSVIDRFFKEVPDAALQVVPAELADEKARAVRVLKACHAREIHYWGPWAFEDAPSMVSRAIPVFFYGLFMDVDVLREKGIHPREVRQASVRGFSIRIGHRTTLVPDEQGRAYGMLMLLSHDEIDRLYADHSVRMYRPEAILCELEGGDHVAALCFMLPQPPAPDERNDSYAQPLRALGRRLGLPATYVDGMGG